MSDRPAARNSSEGDAAQTLSEAVTAHRAGDTIFTEGEAGESMYIVASGTVVLVRASGAEDVVLERLGEGDFFGEDALLTGAPRTCTAKAASECRLLEVASGDFEELLQNRDAVRHMLRKLALLRTGSSHEVRLPAQAPPPEKRPVMATACRLVSATGTAFMIEAVPETLIGRYDHTNKKSPDVDLSELDTTRSLSRRHARVHHRDGTFVLREERGVANGTFLDDERLEPERDYPLDDGCRLRLGLVELTVHLVS